MLIHAVLLLVSFVVMLYSLNNIFMLMAFTINSKIHSARYNLSMWVSWIICGAVWTATVVLW